MVADFDRSQRLGRRLHHGNEPSRAEIRPAEAGQPPKDTQTDFHVFVERLPTPLQFVEHLNRAFTDAFNFGAEKVFREIVENTLSAGFDSLDARLVRIGYTPEALPERFDTHPTEIRRFLNGRLDPERTVELGAALRNAGIPA